MGSMWNRYVAFVGDLETMGRMNGGGEVEWNGTSANGWICAAVLSRVHNYGMVIGMEVDDGGCMNMNSCGCGYGGHASGKSR